MPGDVHLTFTLLGYHTLFVRRGQTHRRRDGNCLEGLPCFPLRCLAAPLSKAGKMCLTDLCNRSTTRAPTDRSIPGRTTFVELTAHRFETCSERPRGVLPPCGDRTPGGRVLDGTFQLWRNRPQPCPNEEGPSTAPGDATSPRRFQPRARLFDLASDTSCPTPLGFGDRIAAGQREPFGLRSRQREQPSRPEVPSIDKCSRRNPPPRSRLSHRRAGFQRSFASRMLAHTEARPSTDPQVLHLRARWPRAACPLLQPKRPATTAAGTDEPRALRFRCNPSTLRCLGGWQRPLRDGPTENSRARGEPRQCQDTLPPR